MHVRRREHGVPGQSGARHLLRDSATSSRRRAAACCIAALSCCIAAVRCAHGDEPFGLHTVLSFDERALTVADGAAIATYEIGAAGGAILLQRSTRAAAPPGVPAGARLAARTADGRFVTYTDGGAAWLVEAAPGAAPRGERLSVDAAGRAVAGVAGPVSRDGRVALFLSSAPSLPGTHGSRMQLFLRDRSRGTTRLVSASDDGQPADDGVFWPSLADDGRRVAFASRASNLASADGNDAIDVFVRALETDAGGEITLGPIGAASLAPGRRAGDAPTGGHDPRLAGDGRALVYVGAAPVEGPPAPLSLAAPPVAGERLFLRLLDDADPRRGTTLPVLPSSERAPPVAAPAESGRCTPARPALSDDARLLAFSGCDASGARRLLALDWRGALAARERHVGELTIDSRRATPAMTPFRLEAGHVYLLSARGRYAYGRGDADAECSAGEGDPVWRRRRYPLLPPAEAAADFLDLSVADEDLDWQPEDAPTDGAGERCSPGHAYRALFAPRTTGPLAVTIRDTFHRDNRGSIVLRVFTIE